MAEVNACHETDADRGVSAVQHGYNLGNIAIMRKPAWIVEHCAHVGLQDV